MLKLHAVSRDKQFYKVSEDPASKEWYGATDAVKRYIGNNVNVGDEVEIKFEEQNGKRILTHILVTKKSERINNIEYQRPKTPEEREEIKKLSVLSSTCEAIRSMAGQFQTIQDLETTVLKLYNTLISKL